MKISSAANDQDIDVRPLNYVRMYKWTDDQWSTVNISAGYSSNTQASATPYLIIPGQKGKFKVYLECEGFLASKSIGGKADGCWNGFICYDPSAPCWRIGEYMGCKITNVQSSQNYVSGHPDAVVNNCALQTTRAVEADFWASFDLTCEDDDAKWLLFAPPVQKASGFNYVVSYGNYTDKVLELGSVSISIDEVGSDSAKMSTCPRGGIVLRPGSLAEPLGETGQFPSVRRRLDFFEASASA